VSKKLKEKQRRRLAEEAKKARARKEHRRANLITAGVAGLVVIAVLFLVVFQGSDESESGNVGVSASEAHCGDTETFPSEGNQHVQGNSRVDYKASPPTTGNHWPPGQEADPGFYAEPVASESLVHNQEHGQIVIWYKPDAPQEVRDQIEQLVDQAPRVNIAAPWDDIDSPYNFTMTAWDGESNEGVQQSCELPSQEVWDEFRAEHQGRGPEQVGIPTFTASS
jgi:hypothetical protein